MARRAKGEGTVRLRKDGRWEGTYIAGVDENGKKFRKNVLAKSKLECVEKLNAAQAQYAKEQEIIANCGYLKEADPTLNSWYKIWVENFLNGAIKEYTLFSYCTTIERYILPRIGDLKLSEIDGVVCQKMCNDLLTNGRTRDVKNKGPGLSSVKVQDVKRLLGNYLQKAVDEGIIEKNPTKKVKIPNDKKIEMQTMKREEIGVFLEEAKRSGLYEFYLLELSTGLRLGEITALTWDDFNYKYKTITVNKNAPRVYFDNETTTPKTENSVRTLQLTDDCATLLECMKLRKPDDSNIMFPDPKTGGMRNGSAVTVQLHRIQRRAGLPRIRFHDLRHTFATLMLEQGVDIKTVSYMLGHSDVRFTMNRYMHVTETLQKNAAAAMSDIIQTHGCKSARKES